MFKQYHLIYWMLLLIISPLAAAIEIETQWIQGGLILGKANPSSKIEFLGKKVRVNHLGDFVVGLGRDAKPSVKLIETTVSGEVTTHTFSVEQRAYNEQKITGVPKRTVNVSEAALPRIRKEVRAAKKSRKVNSDLQSFLEKFIWPARGIISGVYGSRRYYNGVPKRPHYGVDVAAPEGSPVIAPASGVITLVHENMYFSGGTIIMDHGHGVSSTFIHLHKSHVVVGDYVEQGQLIAEIGSTGRSTGPHLDWRMNWFDQRLDPQLLMSDLPSPVLPPK
ncbi:MAG: murein DD-endopeptidase MepM/ murein hydrolase activator NlpD [Candidatus Endobugula sp.]|jgi:murein DD-endopeptidase MepM/ murein hydrolase activator NlpD